MIKSIKHKGLKRFFYDNDASGIQPKHKDKLESFLYALDIASTLGDIDIPGAGLHQLKGQLKHHWSLKVSGNWRLTFIFEDGDVFLLDYIDYH